jgi:hypothetical protein
MEFAATSTWPVCGTKEHPVADDDDMAVAGHHASSASAVTERETATGEQTTDEVSPGCEIE